MKINYALKTLVLSIVVTSSAFSQGATVTLPGQAPSASPGPAASTTRAPTYTDAQLLEEFGWYIGKRTQLSELGLTSIEADQMAKGILAALNGKESPYEIQKVGPAMTEFIQKKQAVMLENIKSKNLGQASAYFATLKGNKGVVEMPDGLRYEILNPGTGNPPKPTDRVLVNYKGALIDGTVFDSSERQGKPVEFVLKDVIAGWTEGLQKIGKGGKMHLFVPPQLGYGDDGRPGIPPGSVLVFEIELVDITPGTAAEAPAAAK